MYVVFFGLVVALGVLALTPPTTAPMAPVVFSDEHEAGRGCRTTLILFVVWIFLLILLYGA